MNSLNTQKLKGVIAETGITMTALSGRIGISREALYNKVERKTEFTASEIRKISEILHLSTNSRDDIFFGEVSE